MGKRSWVTKKSTGTLLGLVAVIAILYYFFGYSTKTNPHPQPRVGRGFGATPYGQPAGNPGRLGLLLSRESNPTKQGCGGCSHGGGCC